jgi:regulatory protein
VARRHRREPDEGDRDLGPPADPESVARTIVLTKLTAKARSRRELADALAARDVPDEVANRVLDRFAEVGLVDDAAFADAWVHSRQAGRGLSRRALTHELRRKGVDDEVIAASVDRIDPAAERAAAARLVSQRLRSLARFDRETKYRRLTALLARKGYGPGLAAEVVREALAGDTCADMGPDDPVRGGRITDADSTPWD